MSPVSRASGDVSNSFVLTIPFCQTAPAATISYTVCIYRTGGKFRGWKISAIPDFALFRKFRGY